MRTLRLAHLAAQAEGMRLRYEARRLAVRLTILAIALVFLTGAIVFAHASVWLWLEPLWGGQRTAVALTAADAVVAAALAFAAARSKPGPVELAAQQVRQEAWDGLRRSFDLWALIFSVARLVSVFRRREPSSRD